MSNLSNIGLGVNNDEEFNTLLNNIYHKAERKICKDGSYMVWKDQSGAEVCLQMDNANNLLGLNPYFNGKSKRNVCLTSAHNTAESLLDGGYRAWSNPENGIQESGDYPFAFCVPDYMLTFQNELPIVLDVQLTAFAQEIDIYDSQDDYDKSQEEGTLHYAAQSFIPTGLFTDKDALPDFNTEAYAIFTGIIKEFSLKENLYAKEKFYWILVDTLGGLIDVVADPVLINKELKIDGVLHGSFWLTGKLLQHPVKKQSLWNKLFGK